MTTLAKGSNVRLPDGPVTVTLHAPEPVDVSAVLLGASGKVASDADFVFYNQPTAPGVSLQAAARLLQVVPEAVPPQVQTVAVLASLDGSRSATFGSVPGLAAEIRVGQTVVADFVPPPLGRESALIVVELYRHGGGWKVRAVGQGWDDGLAGLARSFGVVVDDAPAPPAPPAAPPPVVQPPAPPAPPGPPAPAAQPPSYQPPAPQPGANQPPGYPPPGQQPPSYQPPVPQPGANQPPGYPPPGQQPPSYQPPAPQPPAAPPPAAAPAQGGKVELRKQGDARRVDLNKGGRVQPLRFNLNWDQPRWGRGADLDLGCMAELADGGLVVIQPLGNSFGSRDQWPWIQLDQDDRSGRAAQGETLVIHRPDQITRVLIFTMVYEGASNFAKVNGILTIHDAHGGQTVVRLDSPTPQHNWCAIAMVRPSGDGVEIVKEERYFTGHKEADQYYGFGFTWTPGRK